MSGAIKEFKKDDYNPSKVTDEQLGDDFRLVMAKYSTMKDGGQTEFESILDLEVFFLEMLKEILKRDKMSFHPDAMKQTSAELLRRCLEDLVTDGIYVAPPFGRKIVDGEKTVIIKQVKLPTTFHYLLSGSEGDFADVRAYGLIRLMDGAEIDLGKFRELEPKHLIADDLRQAMWGDMETFISHRIRDFIPFPQSKEVSSPLKLDSVMQGVKFREAIQIHRMMDLGNLSGLQLLELHGLLHQEYANPEKTKEWSDAERIKLHKQVVEEGRIRGFEHRDLNDKLDEESYSVEKKATIGKLAEFPLEDFYVGETFLSLAGSTVVDGVGHDYDVLANTIDPELLKIIGFRLKCVLPAEMADRLQIISQEGAQPFTNFVPLARLKVEFVQPTERKLITMSEGTDKLEDLFNDESEINALVIGKKEYKGIGINPLWEYICAIESEGEIIPVGKTFGTIVEASVGDVLRTAFISINRYTDPKTSEVWFKWYIPRPIECRQGIEPTSLDAVLDLAMNTDGEVSAKRMPREFQEVRDKYMERIGEGVYKSDTSYTGYLVDLGYDAKLVTRILKHKDYSESDKPKEEGVYPAPFISELSYFEYLVSTPQASDTAKKRYKELLEQKQLQEQEQHTAVFQRHYRGASSHLDFRVKVNDHLEGWTIVDQPEGEVGETVDTLAKARELEGKIKWKFHPDMDANQKVVAVPKATQDVSWLKMGGRVQEPGEVGATKSLPGVFITVDSGKAYLGIQKTYFKEYFLNMKNFKGRMVVRLIGVGVDWEKPPKGKLQWQTWITKDTIPYVLTRRARSQREVPKPGQKAIPPEWERRIAKEFQWWDADLSTAQRRKKLDFAYNDLIEKGHLKGRKLPIKEAVEKGKFILRQRWWKGQEVIRGKEVEMFDLLIDLDEKLDVFWFGRVDPKLQADVLAKHEKLERKLMDDDRMKFQGEIPPGELPENPNKEISAFVEILDSGAVEVEEKDEGLELQFDGKALQGFYHFESESENLLIFRKGKLQRDEENA